MMLSHSKHSHQISADSMYMRDMIGLRIKTALNGLRIMHGTATPVPRCDSDHYLWESVTAFAYRHLSMLMTYLGTPLAEVERRAGSGLRSDFGILSSSSQAQAAKSMQLKSSRKDDCAFLYSLPVSSLYQHQKVPKVCIQSRTTHICTDRASQSLCVQSPNQYCKYVDSS